MLRPAPEHDQPVVAGVTAARVVGTALAKSYGRGSGRIQALADVSVEIPTGELTVVAGPSGSGKTTLLHCLSGITTPDSGSVAFDGTELTGLDDDARTAVRRSRMAFVFQRGNLAPTLTVAENASIGLVLRGASRDATRTAVSAALERVGLAERADAYPDELSGGQLQRAALARAVASAPDVIWADEPTGALDRRAAAELTDLLAEVTATGCAVVVVTHDPAVAERADVLVRMEDGRRVT
jgi:putative ABC transport system ATP-binding protein